MDNDTLWLDREVAEYIQREGREWQDGQIGLDGQDGQIGLDGQDWQDGHARGTSDSYGNGYSVGVNDDCFPIGNRDVLDRYVAFALARSIGHMARNSFFYKKKLAPYSDVLQAIEAIASGLSHTSHEIPSDIEQPFGGQISEKECSSATSPCLKKTRDTVEATVLPPHTVSPHPPHTSLSAFPSIEPSPLRTILTLVERLPFTTSAELAAHPQWFLSIGQSEVEGLVSVPTSGTTGERKRVFCSAADLERTVSFFRYGMRLLLTQPQNQRVLLLMSGERAGSVGHLLGEALRHWSIPCDIYGFPVDMAACLEHIHATRPSCIVGLPSHLMTLCRKGLSEEAVSSLKSVLLSGEWASPTIRSTLEKAWHCPVFIHYGLTESGLAGAVECPVRQGCHIREADIHFSIIDNEGHTLPDGEWGEIVLTTLSREATPLLRYKTGDLGRILPDPCSCGSMLKRLEAGERLVQRIPLPYGRFLGFGDLDVALYSLSWLECYTVLHRQRARETDFSGSLSLRPHERGLADGSLTSKSLADTTATESLLVTPPPGSAMDAEGSRQEQPVDTGLPSRLKSSAPLSEVRNTVKEDGGSGKKARTDSDKYAETTVLELRLECLEPFTARHWEECAQSLSAIPAVRVVRSLEDLADAGLGLPVILTGAQTVRGGSVQGTSVQGGSVQGTSVQGASVQAGGVSDETGQGASVCDGGCSDRICPDTFGLARPLQDTSHDTSHASSHGTFHDSSYASSHTSYHDTTYNTSHDSSHGTSHDTFNDKDGVRNNTGHKLSGVEPHVPPASHGVSETNDSLPPSKTGPDSLDAFIAARTPAREEKAGQSTSGAMDKRRIYGVPL